MCNLLRMLQCWKCNEDVCELSVRCCFSILSPQNLGTKILHLAFPCLMIVRDDLIYCSILRRRELPSWFCNVHVVSIAAKQMSTLYLPNYFPICNAMTIEIISSTPHKTQTMASILIACFISSFSDKSLQSICWSEVLVCKLLVNHGVDLHCVQNKRCSSCCFRSLSIYSILMHLLCVHCSSCRSSCTKKINHSCVLQLHFVGL